MMEMEKLKERKTEERKEDGQAQVFDGNEIRLN